MTSISLPPEILDDIFGMACTDGGLTACALRQTSRSFHAVVAPYRFRIVAVHGLLNMLSLGTLLADLPNKDRRIEHLYISMAGSGDDLAALHDSLPSLSLLEFETTIKNQIKDLLQRTAPDLGSDQQGTTEDAQHPFHQLFAVLCALSMHTVRSISIFSDQSRDEFINWAWYNFTFPALEKLYVFHSSFARDCVLSKVAPHMPATAPRLHTVHIGFASLHDAEVQLMNMAFEREAHWVQIPLVILEGRPVQWYVEEGVKQILEWTADDDRSLHKTAPAAHLHLIGVNAFNNPNYYKYDEEDNRQEAWRGLRQIVSAHKRTAQEAGEEPWISLGQLDYPEEDSERQWRQRWFKEIATGGSHPLVNYGSPALVKDKRAPLSYRDILRGKK